MDLGAKARVCGHIRFGPDRKEAKSGSPYTQMKISVPRQRGSGDDIFMIKLFGQQHEDALSWNTGDLVEITGRLSDNRWKDQNGKWQGQVEVIGAKLTWHRPSRGA